MHASRGLTLVELLVVLTILGIVSVIVALDLRPLYDPLQDALSRTEGFLKQVRIKAMATTSAYKVSLSGNRLEAAYANTCSSASFTTDRYLSLELPAEVSLSVSPSGTVLCFNSRGMLTLPSRSGEPSLALRDKRGRTKALTVLLGGGVMRQ
ncbi:prepilin-type N-terminal cleavage/methylation domain-containing protein [Allomeiothermus silvanus]|uniref:prepilin-type N-terminal cleavage/methylation domain-containing protein n=1 Tax=Allomeiothermus silvanus TaxID=52022 RepID=UPI0023F00E2F|nr:prepilin-type N-terminal cleavage/methylation domain-containing protein [Allomeiothermus silvanus]